jgi:protein-glutamine gamma-glutamyltransferase
VLGYDTERQFALLTRLGMESITWQRMALNMATGLALVIGLLALFMLRHLFARRQDRVQAAWLKLCSKLADAGLPRAAHEGAQDYAARVAIARPDLARGFGKLAARYSMLRYGALADEHAQREFLQSARALRIRAH